MRKCVLAFSVLCFSLFMTSTAYAYLDPGAGSMLLQILLGGLAGLVVILKLYWRRFLAMFGIGKRKKEEMKPTSHDS